MSLKFPPSPPPLAQAHVGKCFPKMHFPTFLSENRLWRLVGDLAFKLFIEQVPDMETLDLQQCRIKPEALAAGLASAGCAPHLKSISLRGMAMTRELLHAIGSNCPKLEELTLQQPTWQKYETGSKTKYYDYDGAIASLAVSCPGLNFGKLVRHCAHEVGDACVAQYVRRRPAATELDLTTFHRITSKGLLDTVSKECPQLTTLTISNVRKFSDESLAAVGRGCPHINFLAFATHMKASIGDACLALLMEREGATMGPSFDFPCNYATDKGLALVGEQAPNVDFPAVFAANRSRVGDRCVRALLACRPLATSLDLRDCIHVTPVGLRAIGETCGHLAILDLSGCAATENRYDQILDAVEAVLTGCPLLTTLNLSRCCWVADATGQRLGAALVAHDALMMLDVRGTRLSGPAGRRLRELLATRPGGATPVRVEIDPDNIAGAGFGFDVGRGSFTRSTGGDKKKHKKPPRKNRKGGRGGLAAYRPVSPPFSFGLSSSPTTEATTAAAASSTSPPFSFGTAPSARLEAVDGAAAPSGSRVISGVFTSLAQTRMRFQSTPAPPPSSASPTFSFGAAPPPSSSPLTAAARAPTASAASSASPTFAFGAVPPPSSSPPTAAAGAPTASAASSASPTFSFGTAPAPPFGAAPSARLEALDAGHSLVGATPAEIARANAFGAAQPSPPAGAAAPSATQSIGSVSFSVGGSFTPSPTFSFGEEKNST